MIKTIVTGGQYDDPSEWDGDNPKCILDYCEKEIEMNDEYCEDHQRCYYCGDRENCDDECPNNMDNLTLHKLTRNLIEIIRDELANTQSSYDKKTFCLKILSMLTKTLKK